MAVEEILRNGEASPPDEKTARVLGSIVAIQHWVQQKDPRIPVSRSVSNPVAATMGTTAGWKDTLFGTRGDPLALACPHATRTADAARQVVVSAASRNDFLCHADRPAALAPRGALRRGRYRTARRQQCSVTAP